MRGGSGGSVEWPPRLEKIDSFYFPMKQRVITTVVLWGLVLLSLVVFGVFGGFALILVLSCLAQHETYGLLKRMSGEPSHCGGLVAGGSFILLVSGFSLAELTAPYATALGLVLPAIVAWVLLRTPSHFLSRRLFPTLCGFFLVPGTMGFLSLIATLPSLTGGQSLFLTIWVVAVAKFSDVGALLIGSRIGRRPLAPGYSPKKTVEGAIGGVATSMLVACLLPLLFDSLAPRELGLLLSLFLGALLGSVAILSDLLGSALKRLAKVKDSGTRIPGIGGGLDLVDSLLLTAPLAYAVLSLAL